MYLIGDLPLVGIDFEYGNNTKGSICAYGLAFEDGTREHGFVRLHPSAPEQTHTRFHGITQEQTDSGMGFEELYARIEELAAGGKVVLIAHDLKSDRRAWHAALQTHGLADLNLLWLDSLTLARIEVGAARDGGKTGIAPMAERYGLTIDHHNPAYDAWISLEIAQRTKQKREHWRLIDDSDPSQRARVKVSNGIGYIPWEPSFPGELRPRKPHQQRQIDAARSMLAGADYSTPGVAELAMLLDEDLPIVELMRKVHAIPGEFAAKTFEAMLSAISQPS